MKVRIGVDGRPSQNAQNLYAVLKNQSLSIQNALIQSSIAADMDSLKALLTQIKDNTDNVVIPGLSRLISKKRRLVRASRSADTKSRKKTQKRRKTNLKKHE